ncbi:hypothetical protein B0H11DRAFT_2256566 [Mycena galericulata]|nr:hypothetical protein B0H11DRAFT_2256566 [Mycena galericulata]
MPHPNSHPEFRGLLRGSGKKATSDARDDPSTTINERRCCTRDTGAFTSGPSSNAEGPRPNVPAASEHQTSSVPPGAPIIKTAPSRKLITASFDLDTVDLSDDEALDNLNTVPLREYASE